MISSSEISIKSGEFGHIEFIADSIQNELEPLTS